MKTIRILKVAYLPKEIASFAQPFTSRISATGSRTAALRTFTSPLDINPTKIKAVFESLCETAPERNARKAPRIGLPVYLETTILNFRPVVRFRLALTILTPLKNSPIPTIIVPRISFICIIRSLDYIR